MRRGGELLDGQRPCPRSCARSRASAAKLVFTIARDARTLDEVDGARLATPAPRGRARRQRNHLHAARRATPAASPCADGACRGPAPRRHASRTDGMASNACEADPLPPPTAAPAAARAGHLRRRGGRTTSARARRFSRPPLSASGVRGPGAGQRGAGTCDMATRRRLDPRPQGQRRQHHLRLRRRPVDQHGAAQPHRARSGPHRGEVCQLPQPARHAGAGGDDRRRTDPLARARRPGPEPVGARVGQLPRLHGGPHRVAQPPAGQHHSAQLQPRGLRQQLRRPACPRTHRHPGQPGERLRLDRLVARRRRQRLRGQRLLRQRGAALRRQGGGARS